MLLKLLKHLALVGLAAIPWPAAADGRKAFPVSSLTQDEGGAMILEVMLCALDQVGTGRKCRFLVDTGSTMCAIDTSLPPSLFWDDGTSFETTDATGGLLLSPAVILKRIEVGGMIRDNIPAMRMDLRNGWLGTFQDEPVDGILGMNFLEGTRFVLDPQRCEVRWWQRLKTSDKNLRLVYNAERIPCLVVRFRGREATCVLGLGFEGGITLPWSLKPESKGKDSMTQGLTGAHQGGMILEGQTVEAGQASWREIPVGFDEGNEKGLLGVHLLGAAPICFDFVVNQVVFTDQGTGSLAYLRQASTALPLAWDRRGATPRLFVHAVVPSSRLEAAGLQAGDEVLQVGPLKGKVLTRRAVMAVLARGEAHAWVVARQGKPMTLAFPAKEAGAQRPAPATR